MLDTLYSFRRCPYAIRARMAILQSGLTVALREVSLREKPAEMLALSPKGTVPVLHCSDGMVIDESLAIMRWALSQNDPDDWLDQSDSVFNKNLVSTNDGDFKKWLDRYKYFERHPEQTQSFYRDRGVECLVSELESILADRPYLHGVSAGMTDVAVFPFVRQFAAVDRTWFDSSPWQRTRLWLDRWLACDSFLKVMQKTPSI